MNMDINVPSTTDLPKERRRSIHSRRSIGSQREQSIYLTLPPNAEGPEKMKILLQRIIDQALKKVGDALVDVHGAKDFIQDSGYLLEKSVEKLHEEGYFKSIVGSGAGVDEQTDFLLKSTEIYNAESKKWDSLGRDTQSLMDKLYRPFSEKDIKPFLSHTQKQLLENRGYGKVADSLRAKVQTQQMMIERIAIRKNARRLAEDVKAARRPKVSGYEEREPEFIRVQNLFEECLLNLDIDPTLK